LPLWGSLRSQGNFPAGCAFVGLPQGLWPASPWGCTKWLSLGLLGSPDVLPCCPGRAGQDGKGAPAIREEDARSPQESFWAGDRREGVWGGRSGQAASCIVTTVPEWPDFLPSVTPPSAAPGSIFCMVSPTHLQAGLGGWGRVPEEAHPAFPGVPGPELCTGCTVQGTGRGTARKASSGWAPVTSLPTLERWKGSSREGAGVP